MPRTTVMIDNKLLAEAKKLSGIKTTKAVVDEALRALVRRAKLEELASLMGSGIIDITQEELEELRKDD